MAKSHKLAVALCLLWSTHALAQAHQAPGESRGRLLYATHCSACHASQIHWRKHRLATDWVSLKAQVRRWQASIRLGWSEEEITDVTDYLNRTHYGFPAAGPNGLSRTENSIDQAKHQQ